MKKLALFLCIIGIIVSMPIMVAAQKSINCDKPYLPGDSWQAISDKDIDNNFVLDTMKVVLVKFNESSTITKVSACVLDWMIEHPTFITSECKKFLRENRNNKIVFTGTKYKDSGGESLYRVLVYEDEGFNWGRFYYLSEKNTEHIYVFTVK